MMIREADMMANSQSTLSVTDFMTEADMMADVQIINETNMMVNTKTVTKNDIMKTDIQNTDCG